MRLSFRQKQSFYHSLGQLLRSGVAFPAALDNLGRTARGALREFIRRLRKSVEGGQTVGEAFERARPTVTELETGIVSAVERTGRLEHGMAQLSSYFATLDRARTGIIRRSAYPIFVLHFGVFALGLPTLLFGGGVQGYLQQTGGILVIFYLLAVLIASAAPLLGDLAATSSVADAILRRVPLWGKIRRSFALSRFCATYEMQLDAGVNVIDALAAAARASRSGAIRANVEAALPEVRAGAQVGPLLGRGGAFPEEMIHALCVGEESGELSAELERMAVDYQSEAVGALDVFAEWVPKLLYVGVLIYIGFGIISGYQHIWQQYQKVLSF